MLISRASPTEVHTVHIPTPEGNNRESELQYAQVVRAARSGAGLNTNRKLHVCRGRRLYSARANDQ